MEALPKTLKQVAWEATGTSITPAHITPGTRSSGPPLHPQGPEAQAWVWCWVSRSDPL